MRNNLSTLNLRPRGNLKSKILIILISLFTIDYSLFTREAFAHCPLCVAGAGAGLSISRVLGIDDSITGVWLAAFLGAIALWMDRALKKKYIPLQALIIYLTVVGVTLWSFYAFKLIDEHAGLIMGLPKLTFGILTGGAVFYLVDVLNSALKKKRGKVLFSYQPITFSLTSMILLSVIILIFINYYI